MYVCVCVCVQAPTQARLQNRGEESPRLEHQPGVENEAENEAQNQTRGEPEQQAQAGEAGNSRGEQETEDIDVKCMRYLTMVMYPLSACWVQLISPSRPLSLSRSPSRALVL